MRQIALTQLNIYPIKSCGGIALDRAVLTPEGLQHDRSWMLVDDEGKFLTQRKHPRMALVKPAIVGDALQITAPDMPSLQVPLAPENYTQRAAFEVTVWRDQLPALDAGAAAAGWFSRYLEVAVRLVRFDPAVRRVVDREWTAGQESLTHFSDGFPVLIVSEASLADLNARLLARERAALPMQRFRPNVVVSGLTAFEEDQLDLLEFASAGVTLQLVKPCARCAITTVDPATGARDAHWPTEPLETLADYRTHPQLKGVFFGQNALVIRGDGAQLEVGQAAHCTQRA